MWINCLKGKRWLYWFGLTLLLTLSLTPIPAIAQHAPRQLAPTDSMPTTTAPTFRRIEQPMALKIGVTLGGAGLIGLELWWFLFSQSPAPSTQRQADK